MTISESSSGDVPQPRMIPNLPLIAKTLVALMAVVVLVALMALVALVALMALAALVALLALVALVGLVFFQICSI